MGRLAGVLRRLGCVLGRLGASWSRPGRILGRLRGVLGGSWRSFGASYGILGRLGALWGRVGPDFRSKMKLYLGPPLNSRVCIDSMSEDQSPNPKSSLHSI